MNNEELIESLIRQGKSDQLEFLQGVNKDTIGKTIGSFLNNEGGQLLIGIGEKKEVLGVENAERLKAELTEYLNTEIIPESPIMISVEPLQNKKIISIKVWTGSKQPYIFNGGIYYRKGNQTIKATSTEISELIHNRQSTELHWERQLAMGIDLEDLDLDELQKTIKETINKTKLEEYKKEPIAFLTHFGLYQNGSFTNAAVILFAKNPARFIPQSRVRIAFLEQGKTGDKFLDDQLLEGNIFKNIESILKFLEKHLTTSSKFSDNDWKRKDSYIFPMSALREGIINALVHRDYFSISGSVSILIYKDRLEISNSGKSPLKAAELKKNHLSMPVNPDIAHIIFLRGFMEKIGRGTLKILDACKEAGLGEPVWRTNENDVRLTFFSNVYSNGDNASIRNPNKKPEGATEGATEGAIEGAIEGATKSLKLKLVILLKAIADNEGKRIPDYEVLTKINKKTIERYISQLRDANLVEFKGEAAQTGGYHLTTVLKERIKAK